MNKNIMKFITCFLFFAIVSNSAIASKTDDKKTETNTYELLNLFGEVLERTKNIYVEETSDKDLIESAINGMLSSLDPHSGFLDAKEFKSMNEQTKGKFGGLGIEVTLDSGLVKVISPIDDTPAFKAGIKAGDYITDIDDITVVGQSLSESVEKMRGKPGTKVKLTIRRPNEKPIELSIKREEIKIQSVKSEIFNDDVLYVRISSFNEETTKMLEDVIKKTKTDLKKDLKGLVLDVRNNPGGLLDQAVNVSDLFLEQGEIVSTRSRNEADTVKYTAKEGDVIKGLPIVVIVNGGSASASEIVAGALQDHKRAIVIGEKTFGKGSVQTIMPLGPEIAMKITTSRYYTPSGRSIQAKGIEPDIEVKLAKLEVFENVFESYSEVNLKNSLKNESKASKEKKNKEIEKSEWLEKDYQLMRAVDLVRSLAIYGNN